MVIWVKWGVGVIESVLFYYPIAEGDEGEACDEAEEDVGDESADIAVLEHL